MEYWTIIDDKHAGPFTADELIEMGCKPESPVWTSGLPDWVEASEIEELRVKMEHRDAPTPQPEQPSAQAMPAPEAPAPEVPAQPYNEPAQPKYQQPYQPQQDYQQPYQEQPYQQPYQPQPQPQWEWQQQPATPNEPCPPAYLVWSIIVTILCCQPLGIGAIICSAMVKQAYNRGNLQKANKMSERAQWFIILAIVCGLLSVPLQLAFMGF
jgi:type IV secretory pathway VirB10-like protein